MGFKFFFNIASPLASFLATRELLPLSHEGFRPCHTRASALAFKGNDSIVTVVKNLFCSGETMFNRLMHNLGLIIQHNYFQPRHFNQIPLGDDQLSLKEFQILGSR